MRVRSCASICPGWSASFCGKTYPTTCGARALGKANAQVPAIMKAMVMTASRVFCINALPGEDYQVTGLLQAIFPTLFQFTVEVPQKRAFCSIPRIDRPHQRRHFGLARGRG